MSKGELTRQAIVEHAVTEATRIGLGGLSIGRLADQLELSKSGLFAHFRSKENLQLQIIQAVREEFVQRVVVPALRKPRGEPRVRAMFENWLAWGERPGGCLLVSAATELDDQEGPVREALAAAVRDWLDTLTTAAQIAVAEKHFHPHLDTKQFAFELYGTMLSGHHFRRLLRDPKAWKRTRLSFDHLIETARP